MTANGWIEPRLAWALAASLVLHAYVLDALVVVAGGLRAPSAPVVLRVALPRQERPALPSAETSPPAVAVESAVHAPRGPAPASIAPAAVAPPGPVPRKPAVTASTAPVAPAVPKVVPEAADPRDADQYRMMLAFAARRLARSTAAEVAPAARVTLLLAIANGVLTDVAVHRSSGDRGRDEAAVALLREAFAAAPVPVRLQTRLFTLELTVLVGV